MARTKKVLEASIVEEKEKKDETKKEKQKSTVHKVKKKPVVEKALFVQRIAAFILDVFIVSMVASLIAYPFLDMDSINKLNDSSVEVVEDYMNNKISIDEYTTQSISISYEMARKQGILSLITIFLNILYFVVFQLKNNGQTLGKQLLKIKVVDQDDKDLSMNQMIFRSMIINSILTNMISFAILLFTNQNAYFYGAGVIGMFQYLILIISGFMVMFGEKSRGIHDVIAHTDVVKCDKVKEMETCES